MSKRRQRGRPVNGLLLLDKPAGLRSNAALQQVKRLFQARKAGHTGSLDSPASGLLPICLGEATKMSGYLLEADKHYLATFTLGICTSTGDAEGEILSQRPVEPCSPAQLEAVLDQFRGEIEQVPPMYSALKHQGRRLYELAYQGQSVEREPRRLWIHELTLLSRDDRQLEFSIHCSKGTYVRTLATDIGERLGCGAHVSRLRRTQVGPFDDSDMITLAGLEALAGEAGFEAMDHTLLPADSAVAGLPQVELPESSAFYLRQGQPVIVPKAPTSGLVRIYSRGRRFMGVGEVLDDGRIAPRRLLAGIRDAMSN